MAKQSPVLTAEQIKIVRFLESLLLSDHMGDAWEAADELVEAFGLKIPRTSYDEGDIRRFVIASGVARYFKPEDVEDEEASE